MFSPDVWTLARSGTLPLLCGYLSDIDGGQDARRRFNQCNCGGLVGDRRGGRIPTRLLKNPQNCASLGTIAVTVLVGPLNYAGVNPKVGDCHLPQPSSMPAMDIEHLIGMEAS